MPTPDEWRKILARLAEELRSRGETETIDLTVVGGVAVALRYKSTRTTTDCDVLDLGDKVLDAAKAVCKEFSLSETWLNDGAAAFVNGNVEVDPVPVFEDPPLVVYVPNHNRLLALKLSRPGGGEKDLRDIATILDHMRLNGWSCPDDAWNVVGHLVPLAKHKDARYYLDVAWDLMTEEQ